VDVETNSGKMEMMVGFILIVFAADGRAEQNLLRSNPILGHIQSHQHSELILPSHQLIPTDNALPAGSYLCHIAGKIPYPGRHSSIECQYLAFSWTNHPVLTSTSIVWPSNQHHPFSALIEG